ncbi:hypothetical protein ACLIBG_04470 [Virgibacillus sp. W0181]|uniref:hypothetical protein n=1 Tax=Virgibacillus sp. W0181 TaxID=3391581 RepID=UPI003F45E953
MTAFEEACSAYGIRLQNITSITSNVYKINDGSSNFALKKSNLKKDSIKKWVDVLHDANFYNLTSILPVFVSKKGKLYVEIDQEIFYLTPWIEHSQQATIPQIYSVLGKIHHHTKKINKIDLNLVLQQFTTYKSNCDEMHNNLIQHIGNFEKSHYMSPVELQVCTHFHKIDLANSRLKQFIDKYIDEITESEEWYISLCHGNVKRSHFITNDHTYLINWEETSNDTAIIDLIALFNNENYFHDAPVEQFKQAFTYYMEQNKLSMSELYLLTIHLLHPANYLLHIENYLNDKRKIPTVEQVEALEVAYRKLLYGLDWSYFVENEYEQLELDI